MIFENIGNILYEFSSIKIKQYYSSPVDLNLMPHLSCDHSPCCKSEKSPAEGKNISERSFWLFLTQNYYLASEDLKQCHDQPLFEFHCHRLLLVFYVFHVLSCASFPFSCVHQFVTMIVLRTSFLLRYSLSCVFKPLVCFMVQCCLNIL